MWRVGTVTLDPATSLTRVTGLQLQGLSSHYRYISTIWWATTKSLSSDITTVSDKIKCWNCFQPWGDEYCVMCDINGAQSWAGDYLNFVIEWPTQIRDIIPTNHDSIQNKHKLNISTKTKEPWAARLRLNCLNTSGIWAGSWQLQMLQIKRVNKDSR